MFDTALSMQHLVLVAKEMGLGMVYVGLFDAKKIANILDVPDSYSVVTMTLLGYPEHEPSSTTRKELSGIVFYGKFGNRR